MRSHAIKVSEEMFNDAVRYAKVENRSVPKQIEYWSRIGKIAEENPDIHYSMIKEILLAMEDVKSNNVSDYKFD